jgi:hypothetical protein
MFFVFAQPIKMSVFHETVREHIECRDVHANIFFYNFFGHFKICFLAKGSICTRDQNCISTLVGLN